MKVIVGSTALNQANFNFRKAKDYDVWISEDEPKPEIDNLDFHITPIEIIQLIPVLPNTDIATPNAIYTIKCSHLGWDIFWNKHKQDVIWLKANDCELIPDLYVKLVKYWESIHGDKNHLSLNKTKDEFFDDYVNHVYDHDLLHKIVAKPKRPIYESVLKDGQQVLIDKEKFSKLSKNDQINLFREEIKVIALERYLIPSEFRISELKAYLLALKKTITNLTKNWATQFIVTNLYEFSHMGNTNWIKNFQKRVGVINMSYEVIEKIKNKAEELGIDDGLIREIFIHGRDYKGLLDDTDEKLKDFGQTLKNLKFDFLHQEGGGEGGTEYCESVIELGGQAYLISYSYFSSNGYSIDDLWDWKPVTAKQKTVTFYE